MAINVSQAFHRTSANPVDDTMALTKAQMLTVNDNLMPSKYLTICQDDGFIYLYDKSNTADPETGKFRKFEGGGGGTTYEAGDGIDISDDTISIDPMPAEDMDEIVTPLPGTHAKRIKYSIDEQVIGEWINGKPLYQRTIKITDLSAISSTARGWYVVYSDSATKYGMVKVDFGSTFIEVSSNGVTYISPINEYIAESSSPVMYTSIRPDINDTTHALNIRVLNSGASQLRATDAILYITLQYTKTTD